MLKTHKKTMILTSLVILFPILIGLLLWDRLPDTMIIHWNGIGEPDGWGSKATAVFTAPLIILAAHWFTFACTFLDRRNAEQHKKPITAVLWSMPLVSLFICLMQYGIWLELELNFSAITFAMVGVMFTSMGNYLPKVKRNSTLGIKVPWALANDENWNATHRFAGRVWVYGGIGVLILTFLPTESAVGVLIAVLLVICILPIGYSWWFYRQQLKRGNMVDLSAARANSLPPWAERLFWIFIIAIIAFVCWSLFTGSIDFQFEDTKLKILPDRHTGITLEYNQVTDLELRQENVPGSRTWGYGSYKLLLGNFENEEFGSYTRYTYYKPEACIIITCGEKVYVLSGRDTAETTALYQSLLEKIS